jgi:hypothetical protein
MSNKQKIVFIIASCIWAYVLTGILFQSPDKKSAVQTDPTRVHEPLYTYEPLIMYIYLSDSTKGSLTHHPITKERGVQINP